MFPVFVAFVVQVVFLLVPAAGLLVALVVFRLVLAGSGVVDGLVVEQVDVHVPRLVSVVLASGDEDFSRQEPEDHGDGLGGLVVARNGDVHVLQVRVEVGQRDHGDVHVAGLDDRLAVGEGVNDHDQSWLLERGGLLVGQHTGHPSGVGGGSGVGVVGEFDDGSLSVRSGGDDQNVRHLLDTSDDPGSESDLVVGLLDIDDRSALLVSVAEVSLHRLVDVGGSDVGLGKNRIPCCEPV